MTQKYILKPVSAPIIKDDQGNLIFSDRWEAFFLEMQKKSANPVAAVSGSSTTAELATAINALIAVLVDHKYIQE